MSAKAGGRKQVMDFVRNRAGLLVVAKGQELTHPLLVRLEHFSLARLIDNEILALVPA